MPSRLTTTSPSGAIEEDSFRESPLEHVQTAFIAFIQGLFYAAPRGGFHWEKDETSEIYISDEAQMAASTIGKRPAISTVRGPVQFFTLGLDDMLKYNMATGQKQKSVIVPGTMSINCCSRVPNECSRLAWIVAEQIWANREILLRSGFFEVGRSPQIGAPTPAGSIIANDQGEEWFVVSVTCPFQFYRTTNVTPLGARIVQNIQASLRAHVLAEDNQGPVQQGDSVEPPFFIESTRPESFAPSASDRDGYTPNPGSSAPCLPTVPHPLNPSQRVTIRSSRPNSPALRPPSIGGRTIPLSTSAVEESCGKQTDAHVTNTSTVKV